MTVPLTRLREELAEHHRQLVAAELVVWTAGNVSARVPGEELMLIKPSGVPYDGADSGVDGPVRPGRRTRGRRA